MLLLNKPKKKPSPSCSTTDEFMRRYWQFLSIKGLKLNHKSSQEDSKLLQSKLGFLKTEELFKQPPVTIWDRTLLKCSE